MEENTFVRPEMLFKKKAIKALWAFRKKRTYKPHVTQEQRLEAMQELVVGLAEAYELEPAPEVVAGPLDGGNSGASHILRPHSRFNETDRHKIVMLGKLSIITLLHEFAHCIGKDQMGAQVFAINLFRKVYPTQFEKLCLDGGMFVKEENVGDRPNQRDIMTALFGGPSPMDGNLH
ncbi:MAG: hypothetical protein DRJ03_01155 [Chloroflexi bacterium]|nr:MAG: hypothetical protein DRJ03_01155 [Chloroflexota bacterium]